MRLSGRKTAFLVLSFLMSAFLIGSVVAQGDALVTDQDYVRHDGSTDEAIATCSSDETTPEPDGDGGGNRQQNEPSVAINPAHPDVIVAGANDYCTVPTFSDAWMGFYVSTNGGKTWTNSLNPGYPADTSEEGQASPIYTANTGAGDPIMDWDNDDHLYYGGIAFNRTTTNPGGIAPSNGNVIVSTWKRDPSSPLGMDYLRTVVVGRGTPSAFFLGRFNDKPSLHVDDWEASPHENNVYVAWTLFVSAGQNQILFSRSTNQGQTFSRPIKLSKNEDSAQGSDIAVAPDGTIYVVWRRFAFPPRFGHAIMYVKSTDGGKTFTDPQEIAAIVPFDRSDVYDDGSGARDCGDGAFHCQSNFVFHRVATLPQAVADAGGRVHVTWEEVVPVADNGDTYRPDGQAQIVAATSADGGASWSAPVFVDPQPKGHQWWPNLEYDRATGTVLLVYYDSRNDPAYSPHRPSGNTADGTSSGRDVLNTFIATSADGQQWSPIQVSAEGHQPNFEMFGDRNVPFHGDYLWVDANGGSVFGVWTDNRDVEQGDDPREDEQDGFDVLQCREDGGPDTCPNAGGLNQNIYGFGISLP